MKRHIGIGAAVVAASSLGVASQAGADPAPATLTYTVAQNPAGTQEIVTWTLTNTSDGPSGYFDYGCFVHATQCAPDFGNGMNQLGLAAGESTVFHYTYPCGTPSGDIDVADPYNNYDLSVHWTWDGTCVPPTTTTTTTTPTMGLGPTVTLPPTPQVAAPQPSLAPSFPTPQGPLAVTGRNVAGELLFGSVVIGAGIAAVTTSTIVLRRRAAR